MNWLIKSGELFELSLPDEVRYEEEERLTHLTGLLGRSNVSNIHSVFTAVLGT